MSEPVCTEVVAPPLPPPPACADCGALIASLRAAGAHRFDPVRWRYIEALGERAATHQGKVKGVLDAKRAQALGALKERFELARCEAAAALARSAQAFPHAADALQRLADAGDFKALQRAIAKLAAEERRASLGALVRQLAPHAPEEAAAPAARDAAPRPELKVIRNFRSTWAKLSVDQQVARALQQAPRNAGPINSHMLVLRSLALMRDISPDYLNRFMSYADTLLCLDQAEKDKAEKPAKPKKRQAAKPAKK